MAAGDQPGRGRLSQVLAGAVIASAILGGVGYLFHLEPASAQGRYGFMAVHTAVALLLLGLAFFFTRPDRGVMDVIIDAGPGGIVARQLLPVVVLLPPLLAWISWQGVRAGVYEPAFAMSVFVTLVAVEFPVMFQVVPPLSATLLVLPGSVMMAPVSTE